MASELDQIKAHIQNGDSFVLNGGAGSGKTHTLIETVKVVYASNPKARVACITYTNVAVNEIKQRAPFEELHVSTIHEFMWSVVSRYQKDLRRSLANLIAEGAIKAANAEALTEEHYQRLGKKIEYREWIDYPNGVISHDDLIKIVSHMFENNRLLAKILADTYDFIFIDEYQDTFSEIIMQPIKQVISLDESCIVGLFGDPMQAIYDRSSPDDVDTLVGEGIIKRVVTSYNRRNPSEVLGLINKLRLDDITQDAPNDENAPNYCKRGSVTFLYSHNPSVTLADIRGDDSIPNDFFKRPSDLKELFLVRKFIAEQAGFTGLHDIYVEDEIIKYCKSALASSVAKKEIVLGGEESLETVLDLAQETPPERVLEYSKTRNNLLDRALSYKYSDIQNTYLDIDLFMSAKKISDYDTRDRGQRCDDLIQHIIGIQEIISLYKDRRYNEFIRKTNYPVHSIHNKQQLKKNIDELCDRQNTTIGEVMDFADEKGIWRKTDKTTTFSREHPYRYDRVRDIPYREVISLFDYTENNTPYSTQHGIKGAEYKNVLVVLDNGGWRNYNFEYLFKQAGNSSVIKRSQKMFYVCCSRAQENLIVYYQSPAKEVLEQAANWFGAENLVEI